MIVMRADVPKVSCNGDIEETNTAKVPVAEPVGSLFLKIFSIADLLVLTIPRSDTNWKSFNEKIVLFPFQRCVFYPRVIIELYLPVKLNK